MFVGSKPSCLVRYHKILWECSFGCKNLFNFTCHTMKFHNCHQTNVYFFFLSAVNNNPTTPPSFSRKIKVLGFILGCCCLVAIIVNFINLHSDYEELHEFYIGYMGRKMLIQERRLTSRTYLNLLRREHQLNIEVLT